MQICPNKMSNKLVPQLEALDVKLQEVAGEIQHRSGSLRRTQRTRASECLAP